MRKPADRTFRPGRTAALLAALALLAPGCTTARNFKERVSNAAKPILSSSYNDPLADQKLAAAEQLYQNGNYKQALGEFRTLADNQSNPKDLAERARFMQGECRYQLGQYPEAADTYHKVLLDFPTGAYRRDCCARMFQICDYWLDDFRAELEQRADEKGVMRWRPSWPHLLDRSRPQVDQEGYTLEALQRVHTHDITGPTADKALFWCGYVNFIRGNFSEADQYFSQFCELHKDSTLLPQAMAFAIQAKNNATGGASYDGRKCAEALHLVSVAESSVPELANDPAMAEKLTRAKFAIRSQQAEKDFRMAEYYERTGHPGSAVFYYELVRRRYAGTKYAEAATESKERLVRLMQEGRPEPGNDPFAIAQAKFNELFGRNKSLDEKDRARIDPNLVPAGGPPAPQPQPIGGGVPQQ
ncbi:tetratricopeptide repeat protein [Gemmata sp. JC717]|uniref:Tetratricopeptide repeat protein n=1 Tax=Gemmata algarum TaxID=2975278 RepID=A0ABU5F5K5_9BACT|nr:tetratricopeptide repeat protein [Gemmata algarum]MDY3553117.1 tetratricopeptide repeat protein [Gemmata algarum]MDY3562779.1 tetratricopeptide repeat protein [Gemmata algarum]